MTSASSFNILSDFLYFEGMCVWWTQVLKKSETLNIRFYDNIYMPPLLKVYVRCMWLIGVNSTEI